MNQTYVVCIYNHSYLKIVDHQHYTEAALQHATQFDSRAEAERWLMICGGKVEPLESVEVITK